MKLNEQIQNAVKQLEEDKIEIFETFDSLVDLYKMQDERIQGLFYKRFDISITRLKSVESLIFDDLETNVEHFNDFFKESMESSLKSYKEIHELIFVLKDIEGNDKDEIENGDSKDSLKQLVKYMEAYKFSKLQTSIYIFYKTLSRILEVIFEYADNLYLHYTKDVTFCGTVEQIK